MSLVLSEPQKTDGLDGDQKRVYDEILELASTSIDAEYQVHGRAGTGKTTLISSIAARLSCPVLAPTNKAAAVLRKKGILAQTAHSYLYLPSQVGTPEQIDQARKLLVTLKRGTPAYQQAHDDLRRLLRVHFVLKQRSEDDAPVVILDESSMVGTRLGEDVTSVARQVVAFGDPWQLPPVQERGFFTNRAPNVTLRTIYRQARGSGILDMAYEAYEHYNTRPRSRGDDARAIRGESLSVDKYLDVLLDAQQVLVGTHRTRRLINHHLRHVQDLPPVPVKGDTLTCVRSPNQEDRDAGLVNGYSYRVERVKRRADGTIILHMTDIFSDESVIFRMDAQRFLDATLPFENGGLPEDEPSNPPLDFDWALTVHKAQGSEWRRVVVQNESMVFHTAAKKWLYTAITRAMDKVTVVTGRPSLPRLPRSYVKSA